MEFKAFQVSWFDELARILARIENIGVWPDGLLDAYMAMIPKTDGDATPSGQRPLSVLPVIYRVGPLLGWVILRIGSGLGFLILFFVLGVVVSSVEAWYTAAFDIEEVLAGASDSDVHLFCC